MVVGAMAPDFLYFILLSHTSRFGHTAKGIFTFSLPAGLLAVFIFHYLCKRPLLSLAPDHLAKRIYPEELHYSMWPVTRLAMVSLSVLIGVLTHVLWDDFTHERGLFVTVAPELKLYFGLHMPLYSFLQFASSAAGALFLAWAYWRWVKRTPLRETALIPQFSLASRVVLLVVGIAAIAAFALPYGIYFANRDPAGWWSELIVKSLIAGITALFIEVLTFSVAWHLRRPEAPEADSRADASMAD
jgi:hypothetical protein